MRLRRVTSFKASCEDALASQQMASAELLIPSAKDDESLQLLVFILFVTEAILEAVAEA